MSETVPAASVTTDQSTTSGTTQLSIVATPSSDDNLVFGHTDRTYKEIREQAPRFRSLAALYEWVAGGAAAAGQGTRRRLREILGNEEYNRLTKNKFSSRK